MKRFLLGILALTMLLAVGLSGCSTEVEAYTESAQVINAKVNQEFTIALGANATTGYSWQAAFDKDSLQLVNQEYKENDNTVKPVVGAGGTAYFNFKALKSGENKITFTYYRPWETPKADDQTQTFTIVVK
jgi:inhibitor of cysteine peptidase